MLDSYREWKVSTSIICELGLSLQIDIEWETPPHPPPPQEIKEVEPWKSLVFKALVSSPWLGGISRNVQEDLDKFLNTWKSPGDDIDQRQYMEPNRYWVSYK